MNPETATFTSQNDQFYATVANTPHETIKLKKQAPTMSQANTITAASSSGSENKDSLPKRKMPNLRF